MIIMFIIFCLFILLIHLFDKSLFGLYPTKSTKVNINVIPDTPMCCPHTLCHML